jgi:hypothetical protein
MNGTGRLLNEEMYAYTQWVVQLVEAPHYKPEGRGFDSQYNPSSHTKELELTQPLTEMSIRNISPGVKVAGATFMS